jgi:hypothetical protein
MLMPRSISGLLLMFRRMSPVARCSFPLRSSRSAMSEMDVMSTRDSRQSLRSRSVTVLPSTAEHRSCTEALSIMFLARQMVVTEQGGDSSSAMCEARRQGGARAS